MVKFVPQTIAKVQRDFANGLSPVALVEECLSRIEDSDGTYNAMIFVGHRDALDDARLVEAEFASGKRRGSLHGIPIAVKDVIDVRG